VAVLVADKIMLSLSQVVAVSQDAVKIKASTTIVRSI